MSVSETKAMAERHEKLRERPICGFGWTAFRHWFQDSEWHVHICRKIRNHAHRECKCHCGARRVR